MKIPNVAAVVKHPESDGRHAPDVPQCHVCTSLQRDRIETLLLAGVSPPSIVRKLEGQNTPSAQSVARHRRRGHLGVDYVEVRERLHQKSVERWQQLGRLATDQAVAQAIEDELTLLVGARRLHEGSLVLTASDFVRVLERIRLLDLADRELQQRAKIGGERLSWLKQALCRILQLSYELGGDEHFFALTEAIAGDEVACDLLFDRTFSEVWDRFQALVVDKPWPEEWLPRDERGRAAVLEEQPDHPSTYVDGPVAAA